MPKLLRLLAATAAQSRARRTMNKLMVPLPGTHRAAVLDQLAAAEEDIALAVGPEITTERGRRLCDIHANSARFVRALATAERVPFSSEAARRLLGDDAPDGALIHLACYAGIADTAHQETLSTHINGLYANLRVHVGLEEALILGALADIYRHAHKAATRHGEPL